MENLISKKTMEQPSLLDPKASAWLHKFFYNLWRTQYVDMGVQMYTQYF